MTMTKKTMTTKPHSKSTGKGPVLIVGALTFMAMSSIFLIRPTISNWSWTGLLIVYSLMGVGRATFEGTLRATFADFFSNDKEGAFANIILQSGLFSALGFLGFPHLLCDKADGDGCVEYKDNTIHNVRLMETIVIVTGGLAIIGYMRAACLFAIEKKKEERAFGAVNGKNMMESV